MIQDKTYTFTKALRAVLVAAMMLLTGGLAMAQVTVNGNVYGGGNAADVGANATVNIAAGSMVNVYGGGKGEHTTVVGDVTVNIGKFTKTTSSGTETVTGAAAITGSVYGGSALGTVNSAVTKNDAGTIIGRTPSNNKSTSVNIYRSTINGSVYGGGEGDNTNEAQVCKGVTVTIGSSDDDNDDPTIKGSVYGGCNANGVLWEKSEVNVLRGSIGTVTGETLDEGTGNVHGGGFGQKTLVQGDVEVNIGTSTTTTTGEGDSQTTTTSYSGAATIYGDVYGGSAKGNVNAKKANDYTDETPKYEYNGSNGSITTVVKLYGGTISGNVYGGGLADADHAANVYGPVTVNVGTGTVNSTTGFATKTGGSATISGSVYGCNNANGSPQGDVSVNIYKTAQTTPQGATYTTDDGTNGAPTYAIANVFGGGNKASYAPEGTDKSATVHVYGCDNTIEDVFGGGDAAAAYGVVTIIDGGRFGRVFGGGNGEVTAANIGAGGTDLTVHGGYIGQLFAGSNERGSISGDMNVTVDNASSCEEEIVDYFGGSNMADLGSAESPITLNTVINCGAGTFRNVYGGCNLANIIGNVTLSIYGGTYTNVFGGSKGRVASSGVDAKAANITGTVTLNLYGGTMDNAFGGSDANGNITGKITVNMLDLESSSCGLTVHNIYGGGRDAAYTPTTPGAYPEVNLIHGTVSKKAVTNNNTTTYTGGNVFGGGLGSDAVVTSNPTVNVGYIASMSELVTSLLPTNTSLSTASVTVAGDIYGGGEEAAVSGNSLVTVQQGSVDNMTITTAVTGNVFGGGKAANVNGAPTVNINGGSVSTGVYGGCNTSGTVSGDITVNVTNGTIGAAAQGTQGEEGYVAEQRANVHGGGYGSSTATSGNVAVTINGASAAIYGDVYGGSALGNVNDAAADATTVTLSAGTIHGNIYGGGLGNSEHAAAVNGAVTVTVNGGTVSDVFGCNNTNGSPKSTVTVTINETTSGTMSVRDVFGGGNLATATVAPEVDINAGSVRNVYGGGNQAGVAGSSVNVIGGTITAGLYGGCNTSGTVSGNVALSVTGGTIGAGSVSEGITTKVNVHGGGYGPNTYVKGNVAVNIGSSATSTTGEGESQTTTTSYSGGATIYGDVYGGGALGHVNAEANAGENAATVPITFYTNATTIVNLYKGNIYGDVYGGGLGEKTPEDHPAYVGGNVTVNQHEAQFHLRTSTFNNSSNDDDKYLSSGRIFGANNVNGSPKGHVLVHVYNSKPSLSSYTDYDIATVFGGGNEADYMPEDTQKSTEVIIEGCSNTSIKDVYGGGNAAAVPATEVLILGDKKIDNVFGGGNGERGSDYAAHVGYYGASKTSYGDNNGTGKTFVKLVGGKINTVYGGSNSNGDVRRGTNITMPSKDNYSAYDCCTSLVTNDVYGGGKNADMSSGTNIVLGCMPDDWIEDIYAGSQEADIEGDVSLTITSGKFERVFGGNKKSGMLKGSITVNIEETTDCATPIVIGELYGGGYKAGYSVYGYNSDGTPKTKTTFDHENSGKPEAEKEKPYDAPQLNVCSFTSIGAIYGGGYEALMIADPTVNINVVKGSRADDATLHTGTDDTYPVLDASATMPKTPSGLPYPVHKKGTIGAIGNVFGGGNLATVDGSATVNIGTETTIELTSVDDITSTTDIDEKHPAVEGANITGNVYGGGNLADVTGDTRVNICTKDGSTSVAEGTAKVTIEGDVFGAGKGSETDAMSALVKGNSFVYMGGGTVKNNVYGGGQLASVGDYTSPTATTGEAPTGTATVNIFGGTVGNNQEYTDDADHELTHTRGGNVFAGGMGRMYKQDGETPISDIDWWELGKVKSTKVTISGGTIKSNVYGGGELGQVVGTHAAKNAANQDVSVGTEIIINGGTIGTEIKDGETVKYTFGSVFGGGYGSLEEKVGASYPKYIAGRVKSGTRVNMTAGTVLASVYGGGEMAAVGESKVLATQTNPVIPGETLTGTEGAPLEANTHVIISGGTIGKDKVGSGTNATYFGGAKMGNVYGGGSGHNNTVRSGHVYGNTNVTISGGTIYHNIYGGGAYGSVGEFGYITQDVNGAPKVSGLSGLVEGRTNTGVATVTITGGTIGVDGHENGMVFGSSRGDINAPGERDDHTAWVNKTYVTIGTEGAETGPTIKGSIYGSGENGHVFNNTEVAIHSGTIGIHDGSDADATRGNVYGGGCGEDKYDSNNDGVDDAYNPLSGIVYGNTKVTMDGGTVLHNIYGAGALGSVGKYDNNSVITSGGKTTIEISGGVVGHDGDENGNVYGAARGDVDATQTGISQVKETEVKIMPNADAAKTANIKGSVFGGGQAGIVQGSVAVNMTGGLVDHDVYGGGALANTQTSNWQSNTLVSPYHEVTDLTTSSSVTGLYTKDGDNYTVATGTAQSGNKYYKLTDTKVNLTGGTVRDVYGGGRGELGNNNETETDDTPANVYGPVTVTVTGGNARNVFGCNNVYGTPKSTVEVFINGTAATVISEGVKTYALQGVYGGGNLAHYDPVTTGNYPTVTVNGCNTSIKDVFGGGNAAAVPYTKVTINGGDIDRVFAGGNGYNTQNTPAHVGYKNTDADPTTDPTTDSYGTGTSSAIIVGGTINHIFGGSNANGKIRVSSDIDVDKSTAEGACNMIIGEIYGGGNLANGNAGSISIGCTGSIVTGENGHAAHPENIGKTLEGIGAVYGGANQANVGTEDSHSNIEVNINSGIVANVFGGNNTSGTIYGGITVNIEKTSDACGWYVGNVFGGGNLAAYSGSPAVNIINGTVSGNVYGGGAGELVDGAQRGVRGKVTGNPTVTIGDNDENHTAIVLGDVYGGGDAADVAGTPVIIVNDCNTETGAVYGGGNAADVTGSTITINGGTIGDAFGGGHGDKNASNPSKYADVKGDVTFNVYGGTIGRVFAGSNSRGAITGTSELTINKTGSCPMKIGEVYGGGNEAAGNASSINIGCTGTWTTTGEKNHTNANTTDNRIGYELEGIGYVYGGANQADIVAAGEGKESNIVVNINSGIVDNVFGGNNTSGNIYGSITVNIEKDEDSTCGWYVGNVYGGGNLAAYSGSPAVNIKNGTVSHNVYGGGKGQSAVVTGSPIVTIGDATEGYVAIVTGDVYGGGDAAAVTGNTTVTYDDNNASSTVSNLFGGGNAAGVSGTSTVTLTSGTVTNSVYGGSNASGTIGSTNVTVTGGTVEDVFGGGYGANTFVAGNVEVNVGKSTTTTTGEGESQTTTTTISGDATINGDVYGGGALGHVNGTKNNAYTPGGTELPITPTTNATTIVNLLKGLIKGDAYGGGLGQKNGFNGATADAAAYLGGKVFVNLNGAAFNVDYENTTDVLKDANGNTVMDGENPKYVQVVKSGRVFGCNNLNGYPLDDVKVTVNKTVPGNRTRSTTANKNNTDATFEVAAVYGGGNLADNSASGTKMYVEINGCEDTSVRYVYGGGNAAAVPATNVLVNAAYEIEYVFGGGNGKDKYKNDSGWQPNPGADVNGTVGTVSANTLLLGGVIHEAYGGSNELGTITGSVVINSDNDTNPDCTLDVGKIYGAGKNADINGDLIVILGCMPGDENPTAEVYGGAENANVKGNVELTITSGSFGKVFGGNNQSGAIFGHIKLNIEETGCTPIKIDELYLGGNQAAYSKYGFYENGTIDGTNKPRYVAKSASDTHDAVYFSENDHTIAPYADPELNVISFTHIGKMFGGGLGERATLYGNPTVNINQTYGKAYRTEGETQVYDVTSTTLGTIGDVFGGGNAANVEGNTTVNIATETKVYLTSVPDDDTTTDVNESERTVLGANITGNVYGGGQLADVTGNTQVNICAKYNETTQKWESVNPGTAGVTIGIDGTIDADHGNVFGGGKGEATTFTCEKAMVGIDGAGADAVNYPNYSDGNTTIIIGNGTVNGSVYGGGEIGRVEMNTSVTIGLGDGVDATTDTPTSAPEIIGSVYGGGKGVKTHGYSALVRGNPTVTVQGNAKVRGNVYGGGQIASVARYNVAKTDDEGAPYGVKHDMPYALKTNSSGFCTVNVLGYAEIGPATIGEETETLVGHVFGAGKGILPNYVATGTDEEKSRRMVLDKNDQGQVVGSKWEYFTTEADYITFVKTLALSSQTNVTIDGNAKVKGSVFGGSESGFVQFDTNVTVMNGTIGTQGKGGADFGNVYGGGKGDAVHTGNAQNYFAAGLVKGDTKVKVEGGSVLHNIYGGGAYGTVGEFAYGDNGMPTGRRKYTVNSTVTETTGGNTEVYITGGTIGTNGDENGMIFGSSRGDVGAPGAIHDKLAWVYDTHVAIGDTLATSTTTTTPLIKGSIYGGGENGHNFHNAYVRINGGTIGIAEGEPIGSYTDGGASYPYRGNVYGGGCGTDKYDSDDDGTEDSFNPIAGIVQGNAIVHVTTGTVIHNVYGAGAMGSVGTESSGGLTTINISGGTIGVSGTFGDGNVFGAARGDKNVEDIGIAQVRETSVTISSGHVMGNVYGGGEVGNVGRFTNQSPVSVGNYTWNTSDTSNGLCTVSITGGTIGPDNVALSKDHGNVYGGGKGVSNTFECEKAMVYRTNVAISNGSKVNGSVYGGGEVGRVENNTVVTIGTANGTDEPEIKGNVFGAGAGIKTHGYSALVRGTSSATIQGKAKVLKNVYGGGEMASVGRYNIRKPGDTEHTHVEIGMPYELVNGGTSTVVVQGGAVITGHVYGAGQGIDPYAVAYTYQDDDKPSRMVTGNTWEYFANETKYLQFVETLALSAETDVTINGGTVMGSVFGGSESGFVYHNTDVKIQNGTVKGDAFGGGRGLASYAEAGRVSGNTEIAVSGGAVEGNVYGGGNLGDVGKITKNSDYNYTWKNSDGVTANTIGNNKITGTNNNTGICTVGITGGAITGNVFGAGKGLENSWWCEKAIAYGTNVSISAGTVNGNVYGGGEVGRVEDDAKVTIGTPGETGSGSKPDIRGDVFGAGAGVETHGYSALVRGNSDVVVQGLAQVGGSVYGGGQIASVGRFKVIGGLPTKPQSGGTCTVTIKDNAKIGASGTGHNVYGACKGVTPAYDPTNYKSVKSMQTVANTPDGAEGDTWDYYAPDHNYIWRYYKTEADYLSFLKTLALTSNTVVTIDGASSVYGSVYGGGERGVTLGGVDVNMTGGTVYQDVYGGGSLADSNTAMWDAANSKQYDYVKLEDLLTGLSLVTGYFTKSGNDYTVITTPNAKAEDNVDYYAKYKTNVNLTGGTVKGAAYGGGLGQKDGVNGATGDIEATVYGDVYVDYIG